MRVTKVKPSKSAVAAPRRAPPPAKLAATARAAKAQRSVPLAVSERPAVKRGNPTPAALKLAPSKPVASKAVASQPSASKPTASNPGPSKAASAPATFSLDAQVGYLIRRAHQRACTIFADAMARFDLTPTQFAVLVRIDEMGPMSQSQLERQTALEPGELLNVVGRLHRRGLIRPRPSPLDQRLIQLELTADSLAIIADVKAVAAKVAAKTLAPLSPQDAETLKGLLERIG